MDCLYVSHTGMTEPLGRAQVLPYVLGLARLRLGVPEAEQGDVARVSAVGEPPSPEELEAVTGLAGLDLGEVTDAALVNLRRPENLAVGVPGGGAVASARS